MQCDLCKKKEAKIFLSHIEKDKATKVNLCKGCATKNGIDEEHDFLPSDCLEKLGMIQEFDDPSAPLRDAVPVKEGKCSVCGYTRKQFEKTGRLGCSHCYDEFQSRLDTVLHSMHSTVRHKGKVPSRQVDPAELKRKIDRLSSLLDKAVEKEDYEKAARLRDEIRRLIEQMDPSKEGEGT